MLRYFILILLAILPVSRGWAQQSFPRYLVSTVAGGIMVPFPSSGVTSDNFRLMEPEHVAVDSNGAIFVSDTYYHRVFQISPDGTVTSVAGGDGPGFRGDGGPATQSLLNNPTALAISPSGELFICDTLNNRIRKVSATGVITTVAGTGVPGPAGGSGPALSAGIGAPRGLAFDAAGNLFLSDGTNSVIRRIDPSGVITTVAGSVRGFAGDGGPALQARLQDPRGLAVDVQNNLYIADQTNNRIRRVSAAGTIQTVAGNGAPGASGDNGPATSANLTFPIDVKVDSAGTLYISDRNNGVVRRVPPSGSISTFRPTTRLTLPLGLGLDGRDGLLIVDDLRRQIVRIDLTTSVASVVVNGAQLGAQGDGGPATSAGLFDPWGLAVDSDGNVFVADNRDNRIRRISADGVVTTFAGNGAPEQSGDGVVSSAAAIGSPRGLAFDAAGNLLVATTIEGGRVRRITPDGTVSTVAGISAAGGFGGDGGSAITATLFGPLDVAADTQGNIYIADTSNNRVRRVAANGVITTVAGNGTAGFSGDGGPATAAQLSGPAGVAIDPQGRLVIADTGNNRVRRVENGSINTIAGNGIAGSTGDGGPAIEAQLGAPRAIRFDRAGNLFIPLAVRIRMVSPDGVINTVAGATGGSPVPENIALGTAIQTAFGVAPAPDGSVYFIDNGARRIRKLEIARINAAGVINQGSRNPGALAPGEIVLIQGLDLGPANAVSAPAGAGSLPVELAGVRVLFDGQAAPLASVQQNTIVAAVPFSLSPRDRVDLRVEVDGQPTNTVALRVSNASPGIYTRTINGTGQAAATNEDGSDNSPQNPAASGSLIRLIVTGLGGAGSGLDDGALAAETTATRLQQNIAVQIGGQDGEVASASIPAGRPAGVISIQVRIPPGVETGSSVPVLVVAGDAPSQKGVTVAIQ